MTTVLLVDDHTLYRQGLSQILDAESDFQVIGEAGDGIEAIAMARELKPDLVVMDVVMPGTGWLEAIQLLRTECSSAAVVVLTVRADEHALFEAIKAGARGYLPKNIRSTELLRHLRAVRVGDAAISPDLAGRVLDEFRRLAQLVDRGDTTRDEQTPLSQREQEVLALVGRGLSDKEVARMLCISLSTTKTHMRNILAKLRVTSRRDAARRMSRMRPF